VLGLSNNICCSIGFFSLKKNLFIVLKPDI
jgi:hypothetical protein